MKNKLIIGAGAAIVVATILGFFGWNRLGMLHATNSYDLSILGGKENIIPVAIIGSGPAGLSAALYAARFGLHTVVFTGPKPGGLLTETGVVENWPAVPRALGPTIMHDMTASVAREGVLISQDIINKVDFSQWPFKLTTEEGVVVNALTVVISTGAVPKTLGIPGEKEFWSKGVSACAKCDAPFFKKKKVFVIGGGDSAAEEALQLSPHAAHVTVLVRKDKMRASAAMQQRLKAVSNIEALYNSTPLAIVGDADGVTGIKIRDEKTAQEVQLQGDGVFLAIGHEPRTNLVREQIEIDNEGYIVLAGRSQETSVTGVYAAGDVADHVYRQAGYAAGCGIAAAIDADKFLQHIGFNPDIAKSLADNYFEPIMGELPVLQELESIAQLHKQLEQSKVPVLIDCYAHYCTSCMHMLPTVQKVAHKLADQIQVFKVDIEKSPELAKHLGVKRVPTFILYKDKQVVSTSHDIMTKKELTEFVLQ